jgi:DNA-binding transcriptional regulator GbsR (MarR family)
MPNDTKYASFQAVREQYAGFYARVAALYGFSPLIGRLYALLLLSAAGASLDELVEASGAAKSTVSVAIRQLEKYRFVRREWKKGDRRDYYAARIDYEQILRELHETFFKYEIAQGEEANRFAREALAQRPAAASDWPSPAETNELLARIDTIDRAAKLFAVFLEPLSQGGKRAPLETITVEVGE